MLSDSLSEDFNHGIGEAIIGPWLISESRSGVDHSEDLHDHFFLSRLPSVARAAERWNATSYGLEGKRALAQLSAMAGVSLARLVLTLKWDNSEGWQSIATHRGAEKGGAFKRSAAWIQCSEWVVCSLNAEKSEIFLDRSPSIGGRSARRDDGARQSNVELPCAERIRLNAGDYSLGEGAEIT